MIWWPMITISNSPSFTNVSSFEELRRSSSDARFQAASSIDQYIVEGPKLINLSGFQANPPIRPRKEEFSYLTERLDIPELSVYALHDAKIFPGNIRKREESWHSYGQLIIDSNNNLFSESYGIMDGHKTLPQDLLNKKSNEDALTLTVSVEGLPRLAGTYLFLGSMHDHFGHFLVEGLSRLWILKYFSDEEISSLKVIIYEPGLIPPATKMLEYLGINKSQIIFLDTPCIVEKVIAPSVGYRTHLWARDCMNYVYEKISAAALQEKHNEFPKKVFLSRNNVPSRKLSNEIELEAIYRNAGYWVFRPEDVPIGDQIRIVANADCIAGCTGSNMYLSMFQRAGGVNHIFAPYDFNLKDDAMISNMRKSDLTYILGTNLKDNQWSINASEIGVFLKKVLV